MRKNKKPDTLAVIDNYRQTHKQTDGHRASMTDQAQRAESVKLWVKRKGPTKMIAQRKRWPKQILGKNNLFIGAMIRTLQ